MDKTVKLTTCTSSFEAHILKGKLQAEGIESMLQNENISDLYGGIVSTFTGVDILVFEADYDRALAVLNDVNEEDPEEDAK